MQNVVVTRKNMACLPFFYYDFLMQSSLNECLTKDNQTLYFWIILESFIVFVPFPFKTSHPTPPKSSLESKELLTLECPQCFLASKTTKPLTK